MKKIIVFFLSISLSYSAYTQTFAGGAGAISAWDTSYFSVSVNLIEIDTLTSDYGLEWLMLNLQSDDTRKLIISLISPQGVEIILLNQSTYGTKLENTYLKDDADWFINEGYDNYSDYFRPDEELGYINQNMPANGDYQLKVINLGAENTVLFGWNLHFGDAPSVPVAFESSNLPIIHIVTNGQTIPDEPKIVAHMYIYDKGPGMRNNLSDEPSLSTPIGVEIRGSSSQQFLKKSYGIETRDLAGEDANISIFGMPAEADWVLQANYSDKSLMRNSLAYEMARKTERYASRTKFVEVFVNNRYRGVYMFGEKLKRDKNRINVNKLEADEIEGDDLTGGYILKIDKTTGGDEGGFSSRIKPVNHPIGQYIYFQYEYPEAQEIVHQQVTYIYRYVLDSFETALNAEYFANAETGYRKYADEFSFMDYFFVNELSKNVDGYRISTFLHKDKASNGGKLKMGPVWDFDIAFNNADYCGGDDYTGWAFQFPCDQDWWQPPFWWQRFWDDPQYVVDLNARWTAARAGIFSNENLLNMVDSMSSEIMEAQARNFQKWNILGRYVWPNPQPLANSYAEEISNLKTWLIDRAEWMDRNMPKVSAVNQSNNIELCKLTVFPNPANSTEISLMISGENITSGFVQILTLDGKVVKSQQIEAAQPLLKIDISGISKGLYLVKYISVNKVMMQKLMVN